MSIESVLVLGIGNTLLTDEGLGVHAIRRMQSQFGAHPCIEYMDGGTLSFSLADAIARVDGLIVVDAARMQQPAGTVKAFCDGEMERYLSGNRQSVHEVSLGDLLDIARLSGSLPQKYCLVGIEPKSMDWGESPSAELLPSLDDSIHTILSILEMWGIESPEKHDNNPLEN